MLTDDEAETLGQLVDRLENGLAALQLPVGDRIHVEGLSGIMREIHTELRMLLVERGHDFWK